MRTPLVAGNWKMNLDLAAARKLIADLRERLDGLGERRDRVEVAVCPAFIYLFPVAKAVAGSSIAMGAQNLYHEPAGAFTGECSPAMVAETGCRYVILGHSERRHTIGREDDWTINRKVRAARAAGLTPILCVGETLAQREADQTATVVRFQTHAGLCDVPIERPDELVIAYEPVWAIGTGRNATAAQAQEVHALVRAELRKLYGQVAEGIRILYGGSMKPDNAGELIGQPDVDGGLVGGASLKAESFAGIVAAALTVAG